VLLEVANLSVWYDKAMLINNLSMGVDTGELVSLVGPNGAGKSTLLRAITGLVAWEREITRRSTHGEIILEGAVTFDGETVIDNLMAGSYLLKDKDEIRDNLGKVYQLFPVLQDRSNQISGTLSGGEQQMLAIGRALMSKPKLLCIDEPSTGLAPILRAEVFQKIGEIRKLGITILLVEQDVSTVFKMASRNYVLSSGKIIAQGTGEQLLQDEVLRKTYLGL
jgi:branched-chain amino acid transport system ATP-binding protein